MKFTEPPDEITSEYYDLKNSSLGRDGKNLITYSLKSDTKLEKAIHAIPWREGINYELINDFDIISLYCVLKRRLELLNLVSRTSIPVAYKDSKHKLILENDPNLVYLPLIENRHKLNHWPYILPELNDHLKHPREFLKNKTFRAPIFPLTYRDVIEMSNWLEPLVNTDDSEKNLDKTIPEMIHLDINQPDAILIESLMKYLNYVRKEQNITPTPKKISFPTLKNCWIKSKFIERLDIAIWSHTKKIIIKDAVYSEILEIEPDKLRKDRSHFHNLPNTLNFIESFFQISQLPLKGDGMTLNEYFKKYQIKKLNNLTEPVNKYV